MGPRQQRLTDGPSAAQNGQPEASDVRGECEADPRQSRRSVLTRLSATRTEQDDRTTPPSTRRQLLDDALVSRFDRSAAGGRGAGSHRIFPSVAAAYRDSCFQLVVLYALLT